MSFPVRNEAAIAAIGNAFAGDDDACGCCGHPYDDHHTAPRVSPCGRCPCASYLDPRDVETSTSAEEVA